MKHRNWRIGILASLLLAACTMPTPLSTPTAGLPLITPATYPPVTNPVNEHTTTPLPAYTPTEDFDTRAEPVDTATPLPIPSRTPTTMPSPAVPAPPGLIHAFDGMLWLAKANGESAPIAKQANYATRLSPDHQMVLYVDQTHCWIIDLTSGQEKEIAASPDSHVCCYCDLSCQWSIDSQSVYYSDGIDVWAVNVHTAEKRNLTNTPDRCEKGLISLWPARSDVLVFRSWPTSEIADDFGHRGAITSIKTDGSEYSVIEPLFSESPALSPDGQILAYDSQAGMRLYQWGSISRTIDLKEYGLKNWEVHFASPPAWSPDGTQIACWADGNNKEVEFYGIVLLNLATKASRILQPLTHPIYWDSHPPAPEWSPDGKWLAFWGMDQDHGRLGFWIVSANQEDKFVLAGNGDDIEHCADPTKSGGRAWSPDGQWLAFNRCELDSGQGVWLAQVGNWKPLLVKLPSNARVVDWINVVQ